MIKLFTFLVAFVTFSNAHEFSVCKHSKVGDELGVESVFFSPDPPVAGRTVKVQVKGKSLVDVEQGELNVDIRVLGVTIVKEVLNLCEVTKCPLKAGETYEAVVEQDIPAETPDGIGATVRLSTVTGGATVSCLESYVEVHHSSSPDQKVIVGDEVYGPWKRIEKSIEFLFNKWKLQHPHAIPNFEIFAENMKKIVEHNILEDKTYTMTMNEFGSMSAEEFVNTHMGIRRNENADEVERSHHTPKVQMLRSSIAEADPPSEVDWTTKGVVSPIKNQGSCGSCWAFSAIASIESAYAIKTGKLVEFSEQELVSCDTTDYGCQGGLMDNAFNWIERSSGGLCTEAEYGYTSGVAGIRGECLKTCTPVPDSIPKSYVDVPANEAALLAAVAEHGPVSVAIEADQSAFQFYHSGVLTGLCGSHLDHGVLLVGYGVDKTSGIKFWKVKNSWGLGWGEAGYIRLQRGKRWTKGGECGIASAASYPVF